MSSSFSNNKTSDLKLLEDNKDHIHLKDNFLWCCYIFFSALQITKFSLYSHKGINLSVRIEDVIFLILITRMLQIGIRRNKIVWALPWIILTLFELCTIHFRNILNLVFLTEFYEWTSAQWITLICKLTFLAVKINVFIRTMQLFQSSIP